MTRSDTVTVMVRTSYYDPSREELVDGVLGPTWEPHDLIETALSLVSGRGHPAVELKRGDGSSLSLGTDGHRALLVWIDQRGVSRSTVGSGDDVIVFDYFGSWSEARGEHLVLLDDARVCIEHFVATGSPVTEAVAFELD